MSDQCALDTSGNPKDAKDIESESDTRPIPKQPSSTQLDVLTAIQEGRGCRPKNTQKLQQSLIAEKLDDDGRPQKSHSRNKHPRKVKRVKLTHGGQFSLFDDPNVDADYTESEASDGSELTDEEEGLQITNEELANSLPSKTIPETGRGSCKRKRTKSITRIKDIVDEDSPENYKEDISNFSERYKDLHVFKLSEEDWDAIPIVTDWLHAFREATTQMSCISKPMLSTTHAVFRGLQEELRKAISMLPENVNPQIKAALLNAYRKLSDYYHSFDQSPFYTWAAILDPRIMYSGLKDDYKDDFILLLYLDDAKQLLTTHFHQFYANKAQSSKQSPSNERQTLDELEEYLKLHPQDFDKCCPFKWWKGRQVQFPSLYRLATDILSIPGSAVVVERIFFWEEEIRFPCIGQVSNLRLRILMIAKHRLRLAHDRADLVKSFRLSEL